MPDRLGWLRPATTTLGIIALAYLALAWAGLRRSLTWVGNLDYPRIALVTAAVPVGVTGFLAFAFAAHSEWLLALAWTVVTLCGLITCRAIDQLLDAGQDWRIFRGR